MGKVARRDRGREASGALWQYCHWLRAALGSVDGLAVLPITAPPTSHPRSPERSSARARHRLRACRHSALESTPATPNRTAVASSRRRPRGASHGSVQSLGRLVEWVIGGGGSVGAAIGNAAIASTTANCRAEPMAALLIVPRRIPRPRSHRRRTRIQEFPDDQNCQNAAEAPARNPVLGCSRIRLTIPNASVRVWIRA